ncbi:MAG TPA: glycosyltransferase [Thermodesulfobacteriota bacterium]|nr:glycosyltransferase [Thermodesulfobacteriota bacterium]
MRPLYGRKLSLRPEKSNKRRILIITDVFRKMGGSERNILQLLHGIDQTRFQIYVACFRSGELAEAARGEGFQTYSLRRGGLYSMEGFRNIRFLYKLIHSERIDLIVTYHEGSDFLGLVVSSLCRIPVISNRRDMGFKTRLSHRIAYRLVGRFFDGVITVSDAVKQEVVKRGWFKEGNVWPIHNGIDVEAYTNHVNRDAIKRSIGIGANQCVVGLVGNIKKVKGIRYFLQGASLVCAENPDAEFVIIGGDLKEAGSSMNDMKLLAKGMNIADRIHFLGEKKEIRELISIFDVAVISSLSEGFSNVLLEYMASAKPVVATDVGGNKEAVIDGETGFLVPPEDAGKLADGIKVFLGNREIALRCGLAGRRRVDEEFGLKRMIQKYENMFERVTMKPEVNSCPNVGPQRLSNNRPN